jgi:hypothetical protein
MKQQRSPLTTIAIAALMAVWVGTLVVPPVLLLRVRQGWLERLDRPEEQTHWEEFRRAMREQSGRDGPVQRKVPKSTEPPVRVWLRDHVQLAVVAWLLFVGVLGGFFCLLVAGVLRGATGGQAAGPSLAEDQPGREHDDDEQHERDAENTQERKHGRRPE